MGEKILGKLKEIWEKIVAWWNNFTSKQKTMIVALGAAVVVAFVILYAILSSPNYTVLEQCSSTKEASMITQALDNAGIPTKVSEDGLLVKVPRKNLAEARLSLAASGITVPGYTIEDALNGSFTTTEADKQKKWKVYIESELENDFLVYFSAIKSAKVQVNLPDNDGTLLAKKEEPGAVVALEIDGDFSNENATFLAKAIATALGCSNTDNIVIMDTSANLLFSGEDDSTAAGNASTQIGVKKDAETLVNNDVKKVLAGTGAFGDIKVSTNLIIDFSSVEKTDHDYTPAENQSQGVLSEESSYTSESSGGNGGAPGTDSNTETTYYYQDNNYSNSTVEELYKKYLPNEHIEYTNIPAGRIDYANSSLAISSTDYIVVKEDELKAQGLLEGITWEEYKSANSQRKSVPISDDMILLAANASGIPVKNVSIVAFEENFFVDSEGLGIDIYNVIQIALIVIILALLAVVVLKSMKSEKPEEQAEELSVETLLQSNPEEVLDNIEVDEGSETKRLIEKFVDENPEAVANLLRNWLNEDWA